MGAIRVLFPFVGGADIGGSHVSALKLVAALDRALFEPIIVLHREAGALGSYIEDLGLSFELLPEPPIIAPRYSRRAEDASLAGYLARSVPPLVGFLRRSGIDIVHTNDGRMHASWGLPARLAGCKFIWHHRQGPDASGANSIAPILAHRILSVSHFARPARPLLPIGRTFAVVRSPFDFSGQPPSRPESHAALCRELGLPDDSALLGYFGVLNKRKRPEHFVQAVAAVAHAMPQTPVHGLIFGKPESAEHGLDAACRDRAAELGVSDLLHLMGFRAPVEPAMSGVDALLITALDEPFGRTLIEAMHLGTPVVATDHGGNPEAITDGKTGFLVDPADPASFAAPVQHLLQEPELRRAVTEAARTEVREKYGLEYHVAKISEVYLDLAGQTGHPGAVNA